MEQTSALLSSIDIFPWDENFKTGIQTVDEQHRRLVELLNLLASHVAFRADSIQLARIFEELSDYAGYHFDTEETIWHEFLAGEKLEADHLEMHRSFSETVSRLKAEQSTRPVEDIAEEALGFLARWLASHILESDRYLAYVVTARREGQDLDAARQTANARMSGATRALIDIILSIYETLSANTLRLMRELAERKRREVDLVQARLQAEAANIAKNEFLRNLTHEFRTPLNGVIGLAQLLQADDVSAEQRKEYAKEVLESGRALLALHDNLLSLSVVESGAVSLEPGPFEPRMLMREVFARFCDVALSKHIDLETSVEEWVDSYYRADVRRLRQMLDHLMSNAIKFTESGRVRVAVRELERDAHKALLEFSVSDTGIGIERTRAAVLFQPFTQLDPTTTRPYGGIGIGLSIVRSLAELMGGTVGVESERGQGARFWFTVHAGLILEPALLQA